RCTGYRPIIEAARGLGPVAADDPWLAPGEAPQQLASADAASPEAGSPEAAPPDALPPLDYRFDGGGRRAGASRGGGNGRGAEPALARSNAPAASRRFLRPGSLGAVLEALERHPEAVLLAGGTDLLVASNQRHA